MGSLFSPSVPQYPAFTYQPRGSSSPSRQQRTSVPQISEANDKDSQQEQKNTSDETEAAEESVRDFIRRNNRGRNALIQTSYRGVLTDLNRLAPQRKNLLGE